MEWNLFLEVILKVSKLPQSSVCKTTDKIGFSAFGSKRIAKILLAGK